MNHKINFKVPTYDEVSEEEKPVFEQVIKASGKISDLCAVIRNSENAFMDLMVLINVMYFTNYVYRLTKIPINNPLAKKLKTS